MNNPFRPFTFMRFSHHLKNGIMKAIRVHEWGGPEVLKLENVPIPIPKDTEVSEISGECRIQVGYMGMQYAPSNQQFPLY